MRPRSTDLMMDGAERARGHGTEVDGMYAWLLVLLVHYCGIHFGELCRAAGQHGRPRHPRVYATVGTLGTVAAGPHSGGEGSKIPRRVSLLTPQATFAVIDVAFGVASDTILNSWSLALL